jgi:hypothetical protein
MKKRFIHALASIRLKEYIRTKYNGCVKKYKQNNSDTENLVFTFSSTFDEGKNEVSYSCFPIKFSKGIIPYVLKNEEVRRKRKY